MMKSRQSLQSRQIRNLSTPIQMNLQIPAIPTLLKQRNAATKLLKKGKSATAVLRNAVRSILLTPDMLTAKQTAQDGMKVTARVVIRL